MRADTIGRRTENNLNQDSTAFTVSVHPIQQEPGLWFANYMISEYRDGLERVVANVSRRHITFASEAKAKQAARNAGNSAVASMRPHAYGTAAENRHRRVRNGAV
ncbi:isochorismatase [Paracidovorax citrulli]